VVDLTFPRRRLLQPSGLLLLAANLVPLVGVILWGWDAFVLLMLYWLETAVIAFWTVVRIATMSRDALGMMKIEGQRGPSSPIGMALFFTAHAGLFMAVHFLILWTLFSDDWSQRIHGVGSFMTEMVIGTGLWVPLAVLFVVRGGLMLFDAAQPALWRRLGFIESPPRKAGVGPAETVIFGLYIRIVVMQVTIIFGAWFALLLGTSGALVVLIALKTAVDLSFQALLDHIHAGWTKAQAEAAEEAKMEEAKTKEMKERA
jgi:hypothetical protein